MRFARYKQCGRKRRYTTRQANRAAQKLNERQDKRVHAYYCDLCGQRHIGGIRAEREATADEPETVNC